jgi:hypothetical protein
MFQYKGQRKIWFDRDDDGYLTVNVHMIAPPGEARIVMEDNDWLVLGEPTDFESPPSGKRIQARYENGDTLKIEFHELASAADAVKRHPQFEASSWHGIEFPVTSVEVEHLFDDGKIGFAPSHIAAPRGVHIIGSRFTGLPVAISWSDKGVTLGGQSNVTFENQEVEVDGQTFIDCTFRNCRLIFRGTDLPQFTRCLFDRVRWGYKDAAAITLEHLSGWYQTGDGGRRQIEELFDLIRRRHSENPGDKRPDAGQRDG